jgi:hypothetical protein
MRTVSPSHTAGVAMSQYTSLVRGGGLNMPVHHASCGTSNTNGICSTEGRPW